MSEDEAFELLKRVIDHYWHMVNKESPVGSMYSICCCYGGDSTCRLISFYGEKRLKSMIAKVLNER